VLHCGDLFHHFKPSPGALRLAIQVLQKYKDANIPFYVIRGNHDASKAQAQRYGGTVLKLLADLGYIIYVEDETVIITKDINFTGIGEYGKTTGNKVEEVLRNNPLDKEKYNILALHGYVQGQVSDAIYDVSGYQLAEMGFDYIALGHYHKKWVDKESNLYCPGSTEQTSINDWGEPGKDGYFDKSGYFSVKVSKTTDEDWQTTAKYQKINIRPKGRFKLTFTETSSVKEIMAKAEQFIEEHDRKGAIIRYDFTGTLPPGKQSVININNLPIIEKAEALHMIINQDFSKKELRSARLGITYQEALSEILKESYNYNKKSMKHWLDLCNETIKLLGQKTISSEKAEEIQLIYELLSDFSKTVKKTQPKQQTQKKSNSKSKAKSNRKLSVASRSKTTTKTKSKESEKTPKIRKSTNVSKQSDLEQFLGDKK
jgi:DNA repair exonuclease SbcCD nuclease subunit